jgi:hypothetical protein
MKGRVCRLQLLMAITSADILRSESRGTHDHILLSQIRDSPNQVPVFISPRNRAAQLYPHALGSLFVASYDSQSYGGGIRPRLQRGVLNNFIYCDMTPEGRNSGARGTYIARQRSDKQVSEATIEELLGTMFSIRSVQSGYKEQFS